MGVTIDFDYKLGAVPPVRLFQEVIVVSNDGVEPMALSARCSVPVLSSLSANACVSRITGVSGFSQFDDIVRVARFIGDNSEYPPTVQRTLREAFYQRWKSVSLGEHALLARCVAAERVLAGQSCKTVAEAHGIPERSILGCVP
ncbi:hypothetical protein ACWWJF_06610 [Symbiopectobacterium sp. Eva_TO]